MNALTSPTQVMEAHRALMRLNRARDLRDWIRTTDAATGGSTTLWTHPADRMANAITLKAAA
jgi:hypothetical protein